MPARQLTLAVIALVLFAGVLHAAWNAIASAISDKTVAFALIGAAQGLLAVIALPVVGLPRSGAVAFAAGSAVIHIVYTAALLQSYRLGDFGRTYRWREARRLCSSGWAPGSSPASTSPRSRSPGRARSRPR